MYCKASVAPSVDVGRGDRGLPGRCWLAPSCSQINRARSNHQTIASGSIKLGSLFLTLPTRALTGQHISKVPLSA